MIKRMNKLRIIWADSLKGMLIILVVLGHAIQCVLLEDCEKNHLWNLIYSFYMPAFMAISGILLTRQMEAGQSLYKKDYAIVGAIFVVVLYCMFDWIGYFIG